MGPIFHRGRLDGSARLLVIGQDPAQSEAVVRRILVGEAGHRTQGLMAKLGFVRSYVMINTFLYSVYGQTSGEQHKDDPGIVEYRNGWLRAIFGANRIEAVIALGGLADDAWQKWNQTPFGQGYSPGYQHVTHPTQPESSSAGDATRLKAAITKMLQNWNNALAALHPLIEHPDTPGPLVPCGDAFKHDERIEIPEYDLRRACLTGCGRRRRGRSGWEPPRWPSGATSRSRSRTGFLPPISPESSDRQQIQLPRGMATQEGHSRLGIGLMARRRCLPSQL